MLPPEIVIKNLSIAFDEKEVIKNVSLEIPKNKSFVIMGTSGSGKSVFVKAMLGLVHITSGSITINGQKISDDVECNAKLHNIGITFQQDALFDSMTILQNIAFGLISVKKFSQLEAENLVLEKIKEADLDEEILNLYPSDLSGGMKKRVAVIRSLVLEPKILLLDEPTTGLDPITSVKITKMILNYVRHKEVTLISITHNIDYAKRMADFVALMEAGEVVWCGKKWEMYDVQNVKVQEFLKAYTFF